MSREDVVMVRMDIYSLQEESRNGIDLEDVIVVKVILFDSSRSILWL